MLRPRLQHDVPLVRTPRLGIKFMRYEDCECEFKTKNCVRLTKNNNKRFRGTYKFYDFLPFYSIQHCYKILRGCKKLDHSWVHVIEAGVRSSRISWLRSKGKDPYSPEWCCSTLFLRKLTPKFLIQSPKDRKTGQKIGKGEKSYVPKGMFLCLAGPNLGD